MPGLLSLASQEVTMLQSSEVLPLTPFQTVPGPALVSSICFSNWECLKIFPSVVTELGDDGSSLLQETEGKNHPEVVLQSSPTELRLV